MLAKALRAIIIGAPGSGKGTISDRIVKYFGVAHVSSGDLLRFNAMKHTELGDKAQRFMDAGQLVPDDIVVSLIMQELKKHANEHWLLDGFPRTRHQAEALSNAASINVAINLIVPDDVIVARIAGRWVHVPSGRVYHTEFNPPRVPGRDDETGELLTQRADDVTEAVEHRLQVYHATIQPVLDFYANAKLLQDFRGTESNKIWPEVYKYLATVIQPKLPFP